MMETTIPPQVGMRLWTKKIKEAKEAQTKKEAKEAHKNKKNKKMKEKERRDNATILLPHLCFKVAP